MISHILACVLAISATTTPSRIYEATGGMIRKEGQGYVAIVNSQTRVASDAFAKETRSMLGSYNINVVLQYGDPVSVDKADAALKKSGANAAIFIVDDEMLPMTLVAEESKWAIVNVAALIEDSPSEECLSSRASKLVMRTSVKLLGASSSPGMGSVMRSAFSLKDVDSITGVDFEPSYILNMMMHMQRMGITPAKMVTYERACEEGWAPAPKDDIQQAIWDEVHEIPSEPIKIKYDKK